MFKTLIVSATISIACMTATASSAAGLDGINYLVTVTQMKAANANDEALKAGNNAARAAITIAPGRNVGSVGTLGVMELTESDCRLDGGTVVKPGDARCGSFGAVYCRKPNGEAACINE